MNPIYSVVVPVYNEELSIEKCYLSVSDAMKSVGESYELLFVNDGSSDKSADIITDICNKDACVKLINFSRNFGHQPAITAGMDYASGSAVIVIDADLQDPPNVILDMISCWKEGYDVVYGKRLKREGESALKKLTAKVFYRFLRSMTSFDIPVDTGDFRLIDRKVCDVMKSLTESNRYVRGLVSWAGFKQTAVEYDRAERFAGETKYPFRKMLRLAMDGMTAFSYKPLKIATTFGFVISILSFLYLIVIIYQKFFTETTVVGWASTIAIILLTQGIILLMLGLSGEYIGRIYDESKRRPVYIVKDMIGISEMTGQLDEPQEIERDNNEEKMLTQEFASQFKAINKRQRDISCKIEEITDILLEDREDQLMELVNAVIAALDQAEDFYVFASNDPESHLYAQSQMMWSAILKKASASGLSRIYDENTAPDIKYNTIVSVENDGTKPDGYILKTLRSGYAYNGKVIRKSSVIVNKREE